MHPNQYVNSPLRLHNRKLYQSILALQHYARSLPTPAQQHFADLANNMMLAAHNQYAHGQGTDSLTTLGRSLYADWFIVRLAHLDPKYIGRKTQRIAEEAVQLLLSFPKSTLNAGADGVLPHLDQQLKPWQVNPQSLVHLNLVAGRLPTLGHQAYSLSSLCIMIEHKLTPETPNETLINSPESQMVSRSSVFPMSKYQTQKLAEISARILALSPGTEPHDPLVLSLRREGKKAASFRNQIQNAFRTLIRFVRCGGMPINDPTTRVARANPHPHTATLFSPRIQDPQAPILSINT